MADPVEACSTTTSIDLPMDTPAENGRKILNLLQDQLCSISQNKVLTPWLRQIDALTSAPNTRVIIGVVGSTGSGKSSVINALLCKKQLIPTNCMRACTAAVTEISYNYRLSGAPWRATIEFISREDWQREIELLLGDVRSAVGSINDDESEAGIAFAKIKAVYPWTNKQNLSEITVNELMEKQSVSTLLGSSLELEADESEELYDLLKTYIDSGEKLLPKTGADDRAVTPDAAPIEYWPIIRRVCVFGKDPTLETGCVLVDLPGMADSNAARAVVAQRYLQNCAALWIVAPIIRATDEKSARYLLGESFKRQMHRDGTLNRITFICSKTDEIVLREARTVLNVDPMFCKEILPIDQAKIQIAKDCEITKSALLLKRQQFEAANECHTNLSKEQQAYRSLRVMAEAGNVVHPPMPTLADSKKRRRELSDGPETTSENITLETYIARASQTSMGCSTPPISSAAASSPAQQSFSGAVMQDTSKPPLSLADVTSKIQEISEQLADSRNEKKSAKQELDRDKAELARLKSFEKMLIAKEWIICVLARNRYSSAAIRSDFAAGIRDLARGNRQDDESYDPEADLDDADDLRITDELPVFCVSAQGFQKLRRNLEGEHTASLFSHEVDTGIPELRAHARKLGSAQKALDETAFTNDAYRVLTSLQLWASGTGDNIDPATDEEIVAVAEVAINELDQDLNHVTTATFAELENVIKKRIVETLPIACSIACTAASSVVDKWTASPKDGNDPGLYYATFKAVIRRDGTYANARQTYNFASDLLKPLREKLHRDWKSVFGQRLKTRFNDAAGQFDAKVKKFSKCFEEILMERGASAVAKHFFEQQLFRFSSSVTRSVVIAGLIIDNESKEADRLFTTTIEEEMRPMYAILNKESGTGSFIRMKNYLRQHIEDNKTIIFQKAATSVQTKLGATLAAAAHTLRCELNELCASFCQDCIHIVSVKAREFQGLSEADQKIILAALLEANASFENLTKAQNESQVLDSAGQTTAGGFGKDSVTVGQIIQESEALGVKVETEVESQMDWEEQIDDESDFSDY